MSSSTAQHISASPVQQPIETRSAAEVIQRLNMTENVEKGYFVETFADAETVNNRSYSTAIYYLLEGSAGASYWHKVDAAEVWHYYAGAPLRLDLSHNNGTQTESPVLGKDIFSGQTPQVVIPKNQWQRAQSLGDWTLVGTTVAPGFLADGGFVLAPPDWHPNEG